MSDTDGKKTLGLRGARPGQVKQSFSHGRTKNVVVETKRKRVVVPKPGTSQKQGGAGPASASGDPSRRPAGITEAELERRMKALAAAKARESDEQEAREAEEKARAEERERRRAEQEAKEREEREREERAREKAEAEERKEREATERARKAEEKAAAPVAAAPEEAGARGGAKPAPRKVDRERSDDRRDAKVENLSGGQAKMVAIGRALALQPDLLLLDEPLEGLAPVVVSNLKEHIRDINDRGIAVLVAESNVTHVPDVVDRIYVVERGEIVASGDPDELAGDEEIQKLMQGSGNE